MAGRYSLGPGAVHVTHRIEINLANTTQELARRGGFAGVVDLLKKAKHGSGERVFLVEYED